MKSSYSQGETIIAKISASFIDPLSESNVLFYRGNGRVRVPMDYDVAKVGDDYYILASLIGKPENDYSVIISNVYYYQSGRATNQPIIKNFTITNLTADFSVNPGFIIAKSDFSIKVQSLKDASLTINVNLFSNLVSPTSLNLGAGQIKTISFDTRLLNQTGLNFIKISTTNLAYNIPVYFTYEKPVEPPPPLQVQCQIAPDCGQGYDCINNKCVAQPPQPPPPIQPYCGDGSADPGEQCDGSDWGTIRNCSSFGFNNGTLSCNPSGTTNECKFDIANCFNSYPQIFPNATGCSDDKNCTQGRACVQGSCVVVQDNKAVCENSVRELGEQCDKTDWGGLKGCSDFGFNNGTLSCFSCVFNLESCYNTFAKICYYNSECEEGYACSKGECVLAPQCIYNSDCNLGYKCSENNTCVKIAPECTFADDCLTGFECKNNNCVTKLKEDECSNDGNCSNDEKCERGYCILKEGKECEEDVDCKKSGYRCEKGYCVKKECKVDYDCKYGYKCDTNEGVCIKKECTINFDCKYGFVCLNSTCFLKQGVQCLNDSVCPAGKKCARGNCVNQSNVTNVDAGTVKLCNELGGEVCGESKECLGDYRLIKGNECCLVPCAEKKTSSSSKIIGWALIGVIFIFIIVFFKLKSKKTKSTKI